MKYKYCVYKNNLRDGIQFYAAFDSLGRALICKAWIEQSRGGCCDVVKKRIHPATGTPLKNYTYNNYKYSEYDL